MTGIANHATNVARGQQNVARRYLLLPMVAMGSQNVYPLGNP